MEQQNKNEKIDTVSGDIDASEASVDHFDRRAVLPVAAVWARYLLPAVAAGLLFLLSFFDLIYFYVVGSLYRMSLFDFFGSTFKAAVEYFATGGGDLGTFYGLQIVAALVFALLYLLALFYVVFAAVTAFRAFRAGHESAESNRMKLAFKVAFPNRIFLFLTNLLLILPTLYPYVFAAIGKYFEGNGSVLFIHRNILLPVMVIFSLLTLALALIVPRYERRKKMNMFLIWDAEEESEEASHEDDETEDPV